MKLRRSEICDVGKFEEWLRSQGCEILPLTNEFELIRFRGKLGTGVLYRSKNGGMSVSSRMVFDALNCFNSAKKWHGKGKPSKRSGGSKHKRELIDRDGLYCFYCGNEFLPKDLTQEHLHAVCQGGSDRIENKVLACKDCNDEAGIMPVIEKIKLRESKIYGKVINGR